MVALLTDTKEQENKTLEQLVKPLQEYMLNKHHPHCKVVISYDRVTLFEEISSIPLEFED